MSFRLEIRNFQSIAKADLEVQGFTVVTGPNDVGKSAVVRAVRGLFTNSAGPGDSYRRKDTKTLSVLLQFEDGNEVIWTRTKGTPATYEINGNSIRPGKGTPTELDGFGIKSLSIGSGKPVWPQMAEQFEGQVFLLNKTGSVVAEAVADVETVGKLTLALKSAESDLRGNAKEVKIRRSDLTRLEADSLRFEGLDEVVELVGSFEKAVDQARKIERFFRQFSEVSVRLHEAKETLGELSGVEVLSAPGKETLVLLDQLDSEESALATLGLRWDKATSNLDGFEGFDAVVSEVTFSPIDEAVQFGQTLREAEDLAQNLSDTRQIIQRYTSDLEQLEGDLSSASEEFREALESLGSCPICGSSSLDPSHLKEHPTEDLSSLLGVM